MPTSLFTRFEEVIRTLDIDAVERARELPVSLRLMRDGRLATYYAPLDGTNQTARLVIVGITPGFSQAVLALRKSQDLLLAGVQSSEVLSAAKGTAAFGGGMRANLVALLDRFELHRWLGLGSCAELFEARRDLVHTTSLLKFPTFLEGGNYNGTPAIVATPSLRSMLMEYFATECQRLPGAVFLPLGPKVSDVLASLANDGVLDRARVLDGMPHPSGANAERINYVLGRKQRSALSAKTDPDRMDEAIAKLRNRISALPSHAI